MVKDYCERCGKEIELGKCYEIGYGLADMEQEGFWNAQSIEAELFCPSCYNEFKRFKTKKQHNTNLNSSKKTRLNCVYNWKKFLVK